MTRLFPAARDYRTVSVPIPPTKLEQIEKRVGAAMLPGQREQFQYFDMLDRDGKIIGYTQAMTQKGEFGAIELVFGMDLGHRVTGLYIQRARERDRSFREETFLQHFTGVGIAEAEALSDPNGDKGTIATQAVTLGIKTALIAFDELVRKKE